MRRHASKLAAIALSLALAPTCADAQSDARSMCSALRKTIDEINAQAPVSIDFATELMGASALYGGGVCRVSYQLMVNEAKFVEGFLRSANRGLPPGRQMTKESAAQLLKTDMVREIMAAEMANGVPESVKQLASQPGMRMTYDIKFDLGTLKPMTIPIPTSSASYDSTRTR